MNVFQIHMYLVTYQTKHNTNKEYIGNKGPSNTFDDNICVFDTIQQTNT